MFQKVFKLITTATLSASIIIAGFNFTHAEPNKKLIKSSMKNNQIKLYAIGKEKDGYYQKFSLNINGKEKVFNWEGVSNGTWEPYMETADINNDGKKELAVFMILGEGTGFYINKVHIIDLNNINEIQVEDESKIVKEHVKTSVESKVFTVNIDSQKQTYKYKTIYKGEKIFRNLFLNDHINYTIKNNTLIAEIGAEISGGRYIGNLYIEYKNVQGLYKAKKIYFKEVND